MSDPKIPANTPIKMRRTAWWEVSILTPDNNKARKYATPITNPPKALNMSPLQVKPPLVPVMKESNNYIKLTK